MVVCLHSRHADKYRREHGEHIRLDECHEHFHAIHEDAEKYRHDAHRSTDGSSHTGRNEDDARKRQDDGVTCKDVGKQTNHQGKWLGEDTEQLDGWH